VKNSNYKNMKMNISKYTMGFTLSALLATAVQTNAADSSAANPALPVLSAVTQAELPAKASELVAQATDKTRQQTTIQVVSAAVGLNPAAAPAIVGSIAQSSPEMASVAAATAVSLVPNQVEAIARAAAAAAPTKAGQIVQAICRVLPTEYKSVAEAVAEVVPGAGKEILAGVSAAIPVLQDSINKVLASNEGNVLSVSSVLDTLKPSDQPLMASSGSPGLTPIAFDAPTFAAPTYGTPYVPPTAGHTNVDSNTGGKVPSGGRNYSKP
jgi:hypothetical protein